MKAKSLSVGELSELRGIINEMSKKIIVANEVRAQVAAKGIPMMQFNPLVNAHPDNDLKQIDTDLLRMVEIAEAKFGKNCTTVEDLRKRFDELVQINQDLGNHRRLVRSYNVNPFVVNKLVELRSHSPLDQGESALAELIMLAGVDNVNSNDATDEQVVKAQKSANKARLTIISDETRKILMDIALGVGLGIGGIHLLT